MMEDDATDKARECRRARVDADSKSAARPEKNRESTGQFSPGTSGNPSGRPAGAPNKATASIKAFAQSVLEDPNYREALRERARQDKLAPHEFTLLHYYAYGKPTEAVKDQGDTNRRLVQMVFLGPMSDPLAHDAREKARPLPALPRPMPDDEVGFSMDDFVDESK
jgi:hypothetical protein